MAVGTYKLPICDGCKLPWLPVGWTQDSDPREYDAKQKTSGGKPLRCGKCKSSGWDRVHNAEMRHISVSVTPSDPPAAVEKVSVEIAPYTLTDSKLASMRGCSRTAILYARRRAAGLCERCTSPAEDGKAYCLRHSIALARARRKRMGNQAWTPGGRGRPPTR